MTPTPIPLDIINSIDQMKTTDGKSALGLAAAFAGAGIDGDDDESPESIIFAFDKVECRVGNRRFLVKDGRYLEVK